MGCVQVRRSQTTGVQLLLLVHLVVAMTGVQALGTPKLLPSSFLMRVTNNLPAGESVTVTITVAAKIVVAQVTVSAGSTDELSVALGGWLEVKFTREDGRHAELLVTGPHARRRRLLTDILNLVNIKRVPVSILSSGNTSADNIQISTVVESSSRSGSRGEIILEDTKVLDWEIGV